MYSINKIQYTYKYYTKDVEKGMHMEKSKLIPFLENLKEKSVILKNSGYMACQTEVKQFDFYVQYNILMMKDKTSENYMVLNLEKIKQIQKQDNQTLLTIYVDDEMINFNSETNIYTSNVKLYNEHNGKLLKTINNYEMDLSKEINVYEEFSSYYETIDEYTYTFDDQNRLVKVSKTIIE